LQKGGKIMRKILVLSLLLGLCGAGSAGAACTPEEMAAKATAFQQALMAVAEKDQQRYTDAMTAMQKDLPELQKAQDMDALCRFYDKQLEILK
jgi:dihydrodipicolinate synthase/N-acetylneuraminate lyase